MNDAAQHVDGDADGYGKLVVNVEVLLRKESAFTEHGVIVLVENHLANAMEDNSALLDQIYATSFSAFALHLERLLMAQKAIAAEIENISISLKSLFTAEKPTLHDTTFSVLPYKFIDEDPTIETDDGNATFTHHILPQRELATLWDSLIFEQEIKQRLLDYAEGAILFSSKRVDPNLVSWNKVVLLHGPPGTGKTSLCKALAQKLSIRLMSARRLEISYQCVHLIEINSHSLFSRWFSESGKLVMKMFETVEDIVSRGDGLVCLLIDEVESLARSRQASSGSEPSDAMRAVNALLTQLDKIKRFPNVLILATSNISETIDLAFLDRADLRQFIGPPSVKAIAEIYLSCIRELQRKEILSSKDKLSDVDLAEVARASHGLSGRSLRRFPFLAASLGFPGLVNISLDKFLTALLVEVKRHRSETSSAAG